MCPEESQGCRILNDRPDAAKEAGVIRHPESDEKVADLDHVDPDLAVLISQLNESSAVIDDMEDTGVDDFQEVWRPIAEGQGGLDHQKPPYDYPGMLHGASALPEEKAATTKRQELPEELEELGHSFQSALFPGLNRPGENQESPETGLPRNGTSEGRTSRLSALGLASLATLIILGAIWFGSQINMKIVDLNKTVAHLERQVLESRVSIQETDQKLGNIVQLREENGQSIQKIGRVVEDLKLSTTADIEALNEQVGDLRDASVESGIPKPPVPTLKPSQDWGVNLASFANHDAAMREMEKIRGTGIEVVVRSALIADKRWYRLRVEGFSDKDAARIFIQEHHSRPELAGAWVSREP